MKVALTALAMIAGSASLANAACSTAALAGKWTIFGQDWVCVATVQTNGNYTTTCSAPPNFSGRITVNSSCVVTGNAGARTFKGRTNPILSTSSQKPTLIVGANSNGQIAFTGFRQ